MTLKPWHKITGILLATGAAIIGVYSLLTIEYVPQEFSEARIKGAKIAEEILAQHDFTLQNLDKIGQHNKDKNYTEALLLISNELIKNRDANIKAIQLSSQLETMAVAIASVRPSRARLLATEAVTAEVALVSRLLNYNNYLAQLFEVLREKFSTGNGGNSGQVQKLINKINDEVKAINALDQRFSASLEQFDAIVLPRQ